jgi:riboflavin kinase/FMN adenylyltransferase
VRYLIIGHDHHFGNSGAGNYDTIMKCAGSFHFDVEKVEGYMQGEETVSSSLIREALLKGQLDIANKWLGYSYSVKGNVIGGKQIGRQLGFPTANIQPSDMNKLIPADGVYAVEIKVNGSKFPGMLSIGKNPTVNITSGTRSIEVNIFSFTGNIYGRDIEILFRYRLRDEMKFDNTEQLAMQMERDKIRAMQLLK